MHAHASVFGCGRLPACAGQALQFLPPTGRFVPHDLLALYTHLVMATFESRYAFNQTTTRVIGHEGLQESPNYTSVIIGKNVLLPRFSLLLVRVSESRYSLVGCGMWKCTGLYYTLLGVREYYSFVPDGCVIYHERSTPQAVGMTRQVRQRFGASKTNIGV